MKAARETSQAPAPECTEDAFLGGRLVLRQPRRGHRSGLEAVLIAAAAPLAEQETIVDIGAGVGAAGLCAITRVPGARAILVEGEPTLAELATANISRNGLSGRADVVLCDVAPSGAAARAGLSGSADHALANPPFHDPAKSRVSPHKSAAHAAPLADLDGWLRFAAAALRPGGTLTLVHRADATESVLAAFANRFGSLRLLPLHPRPEAPANRIIVQGTKGSRGPLSLLPGLTLHGPRGHRFEPRVEAVLRHGAALDLAGHGEGPHL